MENSYLVCQVDHPSYKILGFGMFKVFAYDAGSYS